MADAEYDQSSPKDRENCRRSPNWSPTEIRTLCDFVQRHKAELFGTVKNTKGVNANKKKLWGEAASTISASSGRNRDWYQVRKKWKDLTYYAKTCRRKDGNSSSDAMEKTGSDDSQSCGKENRSPFFDKQPALILESSMSDSLLSRSDRMSTSPATLSDISIKSESECFPIPLACSSEPIFIESSNTAEEMNIFTQNRESCLIPNHQRSSPIPRPLESNTKITKTVQTPVSPTVETGRLVSNYCLKSRGESYTPGRVGFSATKEGQFPTSDLQYERLQIEREKLDVQKTILKSLRDISYAVRNISENLNKRKRRARGNQPPSKRRHIKTFQRGFNDDSSDFE